MHQYIIILKQIKLVSDNENILKANKDINKNKANQLTSTYLGLSKEQIETKINDKLSEYIDMFLDTSK